MNARPVHAKAPIRIVGEKQQREFLEGWCKEIQDAKRNCTAQLSFGKPQLSIDVEIDASPSYRYSSISRELRLKFTDDVLRMGIAYSLNYDVAVESLDQVWEAVEVIKKKLHEKNARLQKQQKIRDLKTRSVEAQVEDLAQRLQFAYQLTRKHTKVVLAIQLDNERCLFVDIPLGKIQETIERLETLIQQVKALYNEGLRFKIAAKPYGDFHAPKPVE